MLTVCQLFLMREWCSVHVHVHVYTCRFNDTCIYMYVLIITNRLTTWVILHGRLNCLVPKPGRYHHPMSAVMYAQCSILLYIEEILVSHLYCWSESSTIGRQRMQLNTILFWKGEVHDRHVHVYSHSNLGFSTI